MSYPMNAARRALELRAHDFSDEFIDPITTELDRGLVYPKALVGQLALAGFLGLALPEQSTDEGAGFLGHVEIIRAISATCPAIGSIINGHALFGYAVAHWGSEAQKTRHLAALAKGETLGTVAVQETGPIMGVGADALFATRQGESFVLNGTKAFVRNAGAADLYLVFATLQPESDSNGLTGFIVEAGAAGLTVGPRLETMGLRACPVAHVRFTNVVVSEAAVMGGVNCGSVIAMQILAVGAVAEAAQTVGIARAAVAHAAGYAKHRVQFRHPIAGLQAVQTMLAETATDAHLGWLGVLHAAQLIEDDAPFEVEAAMLKAFLGRVGTKMLVNAVQVEGGMGISEVVPKGIPLSLPLARMFRDIAGTTLLDAPDDFPDRIIAADIA